MGGGSHSAVRPIDDALAEARELVGAWLPRDYYRWNDTASLENIRQYCLGVAEENPLYLDRAYAAQTRWGGVIAPPTFLYSVDRGHACPGLVGYAYVYAGASWYFNRPVREGEWIDSRARLADVRRVGGRRVSAMILQEGEVFYETPEKEQVARALTRIFRLPKGALPYTKREPHHYTREALEEIEQAVDAEEIRGKQPRYVEDVRSGEHLVPLVKGPLNISDMLMFFAGAGIFFLAHEMAFRWRRAHPEDATPDEKTGTNDHIARGHLEETTARDIGMPGPYDSGLQRVCWLSQLATNWMGDAAELVELHTRLYLPNIFGDTQWCRGTVKGVRATPEGPLVDLDLWCDNQRGERTTEAVATVRLPSRATSLSRR